MFNELVGIGIPKINIITLSMQEMSRIIIAAENGTELVHPESKTIIIAITFSILSLMCTGLLAYYLLLQLRKE